MAEEAHASAYNNYHKWQENVFKKAIYDDQWPVIEKEIERQKKNQFNPNYDVKTIVTNLCYSLEHLRSAQAETDEDAKKSKFEYYALLYKDRSELSSECDVPVFSIGGEIGYMWGLKDKFDPLILNTRNSLTNSKMRDKRFPLDYRLIVKTKDRENTIKTLAISYEEALNFCKAIEKQVQRKNRGESELKTMSEEEAKEEVELYLYHKHLGVMHASNPDNIPSVLQDPRLKRQMLHMDFLSGELNYSEESQKMLHAWIGKDAAVMEKFFCEHLIKNDAARQKTYPHSSLKAVFNALTKRL